MFPASVRPKIILRSFYDLFFDEFKKYVRYETDVRLLKRLLMGPRFAHWNNAEIGSHIKFFRKPNFVFFFHFLK